MFCLLGKRMILMLTKIMNIKVVKAPIRMTMMGGLYMNESSLHRTRLRSGESASDRVVTSIDLETEIEASSFQNGKMRLQCVATMFQLYRGEAERTLEEEKPILASVLGTRESSLGGYHS
uniref:Uncharacterized protein n=1 Tax=Timema monikensis TaxID=170555 RepID=A0A7R9HR20_9NEOP|nr:unnamed protein product [Timema monikensis]